MWGFGAKYNNVVRHCFQCGTEVEVEGVQGIMDAYRGVFRTPLTMSYPTKFTEVINIAASYARHEKVRRLKRMIFSAFDFLLPMNSHEIVTFNAIIDFLPEGGSTRGRKVSVHDSSDIDGR